MSEKMCSKCRVVKQLSEFPKNKNKPMGVGYYCTTCMKIEFAKLKAKPKVTPDEKICSTCGEMKSKSEYAKYDKSLDGLYFECDSCSANKRKKVAKSDKKIPESITCILCEEEKSSDEFTNKKYRVHGKDSVCKKCNCVLTSKRRKDNPQYEKQRKSREDVKMADNVRRSIRQYIKRYLSGDVRGDVKVFNVGCTVDELWKHLESRFLRGMTKENFGDVKNGWGTDHIIPLEVFDLSNPEQLTLASSFRNVQPMWYADNCSKKSDLDWSKPGYKSAKEALSELNLYINSDGKVSIYENN